MSYDDDSNCNGTDYCGCNSCQLCSGCDVPYARCSCELLVLRGDSEHTCRLVFDDTMRLDELIADRLFRADIVARLLHDEMTLEDYRWQLEYDGSTEAGAAWAVEQMIHRLNELRICGGL